MRSAVAWAGVALLLVGRSGKGMAADPVARLPSHARTRSSAPPLPMLPSVARVRLELTRDRIVLLEEVNLPRGDWDSGDLRFYVAFGAPGTPIAVDARLVPIAPGTLESRLEDGGEPLTVEPAVRRTPSVQALLGRPQMAGVVAHVSEAQLRRGYATTDLVGLRIRSLMPPPAADSSGAHDVVVRLGVPGGSPLTLGRLQLVSLEARPWITRAEATLCGPDADPWPLAMALLPRTSSQPAAVRSVIAPSMAVRHSTDDLCIRWWTAP